MELAAGLAREISILYVIILMGFALVKFGIVKTEAARVLSEICLYIITPCVIINSFQIEFTADLSAQFTLSFIAAFLSFVVMLVASAFMKKPLRLSTVEYMSIVYSNSGNIIIPLVMAVLGNDWVVLTTPYIIVQNFFIWTHGRATMQKGYRPRLRNILGNINMIAMIIGFILMFTGIRCPLFLTDVMETVTPTLGPVSMLTIGITMAGIKIRDIFVNKRIYLVSAIRLLVIPMLTLAIFKCMGLVRMVNDGRNVVLLSILAVSAPSAVAVVMMAQVYGQDAQYAGAINVFTTIAGIVTMPLMTLLFLSSV